MQEVVENINLDSVGAICVLYWHVILFWLDNLHYYFGHLVAVIRCTGLYK